ARRVDVEPTLVEPLPLANREQAQPVRVVGDEHDACAHRSPAELRPDLPAVPQPAPERACPGEHLAAAAVTLAPVDERGVEPERDVVEKAPPAHAADVDAVLFAAERVEGRERIVPVEPEVAREVVPRAERDADKGQPTLDGNHRHTRKRPVAARSPERLSVRLSRECSDVLALRDDPRLDPPSLRLGPQL